MFQDNQNVYYQPRRRDDLPKEIRGKARWTLQKTRDWSYVVYVEGKARTVEFINDAWFRTGWSVDIKSFYTNKNQKITHPEQFGLGTKEAPILSEEDQKRLQGVPSIEETHDGQEEGPSTRRGGFLDQEVIN